VEFALATGCRAGEILGLEWSRVDLDRKVAWLDHGTTKSGDGRGIPLNADAMAALKSTRGQDPRWCFRCNGGRPERSDSARPARGILGQCSLPSYLQRIVATRPADSENEN
jgi:integrase